MTNIDAEKWERWKKADKEGRLFEFPCALGDILYMESRKEIVPFEVYAIRKYKNRTEIVFYYAGENELLDNWSITFSSAAIGKRIFYTREEAAAEMKFE